MKFSRNSLQNSLKRIDNFQQKRSYIAFPIAVIKRYGDDKAGRQAALVTYYAFLSLFPLLLVFITVVGILAGSNPRLEMAITQHVQDLIPVLGMQLTGTVHTLKGSSLQLILEILVLLYGARGLASILQETFNNVWHVTKDARPGFVSDNLRSFGMMLAVGLGIVLGTSLGYTLNAVLHIGLIGILLITAVNLGVTYGLFLTVFRLGTASSIRLKDLTIGAFIASAGTLTVQHFGGVIMHNQLPKLANTAGSFALALGVLFWIYLQAQIILYAIEITAVRAQHEWPRKLF